VIRLQKVMADRGVASRRAAEEMISEGRVRVNGDLITALGTRVAEDAHIEVDGRLIAAPAPHRYVLLNKPVGIVSTAHDEHGRRTVVDHISARERLYPVGRLDTDSEGLLLLTGAVLALLYAPKTGDLTREELRVRSEELKRRADELQKIANDLSQQAQVKGRELVDEAKRQWDRSGVGQRASEAGARTGEGGPSAKS
jgi:23S rRNA pseudouridine2605 synthase